MSFVFVPPKGSVLDLVVKNLTDAICYCYYILEVVPILYCPSFLAGVR